MLKITGLNEISKKLDDFSKKAKSLEGQQSVSFEEILTPKFISTHTSFADANEMFHASGFSVESQADFDAIPEDKFDEFIRTNSTFPDWKSMLQDAGNTWALSKLGF